MGAHVGNFMGAHTGILTLARGVQGVREIKDGQMNNCIEQKRVRHILVRLAGIVAAAAICQMAVASSIYAQQTGRSFGTSNKITFFSSIAHSGAATALADWFHDETGAVVEIVTIHYSKLIERIVEDNISKHPRADIYMSWYVDLGKLVEMSAISDLTDFIARHQSALFTDDYVPVIYDTYTRYDNRRWSLPFDGDTHVLFYRKSILSKYNLSPPRTWSEYLHIAKTITTNERDQGVYGCAIMGYPTPVLIVSCFMNRLASHGGRLLDDRSLPSLTTPEAIAALTAMVEQSEYALPTVTETDFAVARDAFLTGQVAMVEQWADIGIMAEDPKQSLIRGDWGVVEIPRGDGSGAKHVPSLNGGFILALSSKAPNPELAKKFLLFASRPDISLRLNLINGGVDPIRKSTLTSKDFRQFAPLLSRVEESVLHTATAWPVVPQMADLLELLVLHLAEAVEKRRTPSEALHLAQNKWIQILGGKSIRDK